MEFNQLISGKFATRNNAATTFYDVLVMLGAGQVTVKQWTPYDPIILFPKNI